MLPEGAFLGHSVSWPLLRPPSCPPFCVTGVLLSHFNMLIEFLDTQNLYVDTKIIILARILKKLLGDFMLWRPSCPPFSKHVTDMSEIKFNMLNRFLDLKNLSVATKSMCLAHILKKILRILSFGGHVGRHFEYFNFPNDAKVASFSFNARTYWRTHLCKNILCGLFFGVAPKIFIWQPDYIHFDR